MWRLKLYIISREFFQASLVTYLILLLLETLKEGFVSFFFNLHILLVVVLASGIVMVLTQREDFEAVPTGQKATSADIQYAVLFAIGAVLLVYYKTQELGMISFFIAGITGVIVILLSVLLLTERE